MGGPWVFPEQVGVVVVGSIYLFFFSPVINRAIFSELDPRYHKLQPENDTLISLCVLNAGVLQRESAPPLGLCPAVPLLQSFLGKTTSFWT